MLIKLTEVCLNGTYSTTQNYILKEIYSYMLKEILNYS